MATCDELTAVSRALDLLTDDEIRVMAAKLTRAALVGLLDAIEDPQARQEWETMADPSKLETAIANARLVLGRSS